MRRILPVVFVAFLWPWAALAQAVPEGVHSDATGPSDVCGITGEDALAIRAKLRTDPSIIEKPSDSPRFETYFSTVETKQWTVTTRRDAAYPAATCVHLFTSQQGTDMKREMRCDASRQACDALFRQFEASDAAIREQIRGR